MASFLSFLQRFQMSEEQVLGGVLRVSQPSGKPSDGCQLKRGLSDFRHPKLRGCLEVNCLKRGPGLHLCRRRQPLLQLAIFSVLDLSWQEHENAWCTWESKALGHGLEKPKPQNVKRPTFCRAKDHMLLTQKSRHYDSTVRSKKPNHFHPKA